MLYPGGYSETEILFVYGSSCFASKMGQLAGNHFLSVCKGHENLEEFGKLVLWQGAQDIAFKLCPMLHNQFLATPFVLVIELKIFDVDRSFG